MLEAGHEGMCDTDKLSVYSDLSEDESNLLAEYCGETAPDYIRSPGRYLYFVFRSDGLIQHKGFNATYVFVPGKFEILPREYKTRKCIIQYLRSPHQKVIFLG